MRKDHGTYGRTRSQASHPRAAARGNPRSVRSGGTTRADPGSMVYAEYDNDRGTPGARCHAGVHDVPGHVRCRSAWNVGHPFNAGHSVASSTYREGLITLTRPWQVIDL